ncbi:MAG: 3-oxoacyl-[acyl-carrier-protein] reductase [Paludibacteraceae bacterium]|nr:3-oxoacyl-[acyl-carrier-protein] reductase [Paludibacteraceae bacterium]
MMILEGKTALITGAGRGIGRAIALCMANEGCNIAFTDIALNEQVRATEAELQATGVHAKAYAADASNYDEAQAIVEQVRAEFGTIDILVNNAGITRDGLLLRMNEQQWDDVIRVNLKSAFNYTHAVAPVMLRARKGSIISLASVVGIAGNAGQANYAASKAGIIALMKSTAKELGARGVRANAVSPGYIDTDMTQALPQEVRDSFVERIPLHRAGTADEVAQVVLFLASDMASYVSGQVIPIDGAMS